MGYCPFEHKAGRAAQGRWACRLGSWALGAGTRGTARTQRRAGTRRRARHDAGLTGARHGACRSTTRGAQGRAALRHGRLVCHDTATTHAWACLCAPGCAAGLASCALGAPSLFLDSLLFLSYFLGTVHEHCSSQKIFEKKN